MKTYKNKKTGETMTYKDGLMMVDRCVIEGKPDSDFWEEVVESKPLLVTEDGVDVFEFDTIEWVINGKYLYSTTLCKGHVSLIARRTNIYKVFFSKKLAIEYQDSLKIFTTEDGVDIFEGDRCYGGHVEVGIDDFCRSDWDGNGTGMQYFSTRKAIEEYIQLNKKRLSVANVMDTLKNEIPTIRMLDHELDDIQSALERIKL
jgi:hypothetical protein